MNRFLSGLVSSIVLTFIGGCAANVASSASTIGKQLAQLNDSTTGAPQTQPAVVQVDGQPALLYVNKDNRIVFQRGQQKLLIDETARVKGGNRIQLHAQDNHLYAMWWSHENGKGLYFTSSVNQGNSFEAVSTVNDQTGVLAPQSLLRGQDGVLGMTYLDERQQRFQAYFNRSTDFGRTWGRPDQRLDIPPKDDQPSFVLDFQSVESGSAWVSAWLDVNRTSDSPGYKIVAARTEDAGLHWSTPQVVYSSEKFLASLQISAVGNRIVVGADENEKGVIALTSNDHGRTWNPLDPIAGSRAADGAEHFSNSGIRLAIAGDRAHLVWNEDQKGKKTIIKYGSLNIDQAKWTGEAVRLDTKTGSNTRSMSPSILASSKGQVVTAWVDYRDIRPNVYYSASNDGGQTWSSPAPVAPPGEISAGQQKLIAWDDGVAIGYETYPTDLPTDGSYTLRLLSVDGTGVFAGVRSSFPQFDEAERKARLEQRIKALWDYRVAGNFKATYEMYDYAFRAATPEASFLSGASYLTYNSYSYKDIALNGNEATVQMKVSYEAKSAFLVGKVVKLPPTDAEMENSWVWIANDWYLVYKPAVGVQLLNY